MWKTNKTFIFCKHFFRLSCFVHCYFSQLFFTVSSWSAPLCAIITHADDSHRVKPGFHFRVDYRVNGPSWRVTGTRPVNMASGNACPSTQPVLTGNGNRSPVNSGCQLGWWKPGFTHCSTWREVSMRILFAKSNVIWNRFVYTSA